MNNNITTTLINIINQVTINNMKMVDNIVSGSNMVKVKTCKGINYHTAIKAVYTVATKYINNKANVTMFDNSTIVIHKTIGNNYKPITWIRIK